jgi:hypothetical protein
MSKLFEQKILLKEANKEVSLRLEDNGEFFSVSGAVRRPDNDEVIVSKSFEDFDLAKNFYDEKNKTFFKEGLKVLTNDKCTSCGGNLYSDEKIIYCGDCGTKKKQNNNNYW